MQMTCSRCKVREKAYPGTSNPWCRECLNGYQNDRYRRLRELAPRHCACGAAIPVGSKARRCAACKAPKPELVDMTCQRCGSVVLSSRNMVLCRDCRKAADRERYARITAEKTAARRAKGKLCGCGVPLPTVKRRACDECHQEQEREKNKRNEHRRRALKQGSKAGTVSYRQLWANSGGMCNLCRVAVDKTVGHVDHVIPLARGGPHSQENLQILCGPCNLKKGAKFSSAPRTPELV